MKNLDFYSRPFETVTFDIMYLLFYSCSRSFPEALLECMENSRNETLKCLTKHQASIVQPLQALEERTEKTSLLTYLLSWHLIIQLFQISSLDKRAKLANYLHRTSHVMDLMTCLFCMMSLSPSNEKSRKGGKESSNHLYL